jgi:hypothetical protein
MKMSLVQVDFRHRSLKDRLAKLHAHIAKHNGARAVVMGLAEEIHELEDQLREVESSLLAGAGECIHRVPKRVYVTPPRLVAQGMRQHIERGEIVVVRVGQASVLVQGRARVADAYCVHVGGKLIPGVHTKRAALQLAHQAQILDAVGMPPAWGYLRGRLLERWRYWTRALRRYKHWSWFEDARDRGAGRYARSNNRSARIYLFRAKVLRMLSDRGLVVSDLEPAAPGR